MRQCCFGIFDLGSSFTLQQLWPARLKDGRIKTFGLQHNRLTGVNKLANTSIPNGPHAMLPLFLPKSHLACMSFRTVFTRTCIYASPTPPRTNSIQCTLSSKNRQNSWYYHVPWPHHRRTPSRSSRRAWLAHPKRRHLGEARWGKEIFGLGGFFLVISPEKSHCGSRQKWFASPCLSQNAVGWILALSPKESFRVILWGIWAVHTVRYAVL